MYKRKRTARFMTEGRVSCKTVKRAICKFYDSAAMSVAAERGISRFIKQVLRLYLRQFYGIIKRRQTVNQVRVLYVQQGSRGEMRRRSALKERD
uniref:Transposase n=1 Tax=Heterorhabditis bacteriophora TaxID=37862 RepID=A0A1I7WMS9_HETBA